MKSTASHDERIASIGFAMVYPMYVTKVVRKGRTEAELHQVIEWLTGFDAKALKKLAAEKVTFGEFFKRAKLNKHANLITGTICGYRVEDIENPLTRKVRYLDKVIDELAQGRAMEKILRSPGTAPKPKAPAQREKAAASGTAKNVTSKKVPVKKVPLKKVPARKAPVKKAPAKKTLVKKKPAKQQAST